MAQQTDVGHKTGPGSGAPPGFGQAEVHRGRPNQLWVTDLTLVVSVAGAGYVCLIVDAYSRIIVGCRVGSHVRATIVLDRFERTRWLRGNSLPGLVARLEISLRHQIQVHVHSLRRAACWDRCTALHRHLGAGHANALAETVKGYHKVELICGRAGTAR